MKMYLVGGYVRDMLMGAYSKDIDFSVVLEESDFPDKGLVTEVPDPFDVMVRNLEQMGMRIFLKTPEHLTVRAQFPHKERRIPNEGLNNFGFANPKTTADFVLARKEGTYSDGRRPDTVEIGTLEDDLARRDFTMNAIALDAKGGEFIDPFNGRQDINDKVIRAVGSAQARLEEDALRAVRALRFSVTKDMRIDPELKFSMETAIVLSNIRHKISDERIMDELSKMFRFDTLGSLKALERFPFLTRALFSGKVSLDATMKQKGRGK